MFKKIISFILVSAFLVGFSAFAVSSEQPEVSAVGCVLMDYVTGDLLFSKNSDRRLSMASTTKIMTVILLIEAGEPEKEIQVTDEMVAVEGTSMGLKGGITVKRSDLYYGMMLPSGNDAANVAAIHLAGSFENFAVMMNRKAKEIGMNNTNFVTPSGLDANEHYTTAYDMALLTRYALSNDTFRNICSTKSVKLFYENSYHTLTNHNKLLNIYEGCIGVKTGFTSKSGRCLVSAAQRNGQTLICVTLNDGNDWNDHTSLFDFGFSLAKNAEADFDLPKKIPVAGGVNGQIEVLTQKESLYFFEGQQDKISYKINLPAFLYAPVEIGQKVGTVEIYIDSHKIKEISIVASTSSDYAVPLPEKPKNIWRCILEILGA